MIKEEEILIKGHPRNFDYYKNLGYDVKVRKDFLVKTKDIIYGSTVNITTICDNCFFEKLTTFKDYYNYTNGLKENYYCKNCNNIKNKKTCLERYGVDNAMKSDEVKNNLKKSLLQKYGVDHYSKTKDFKNTMIEKKDSMIEKINFTRSLKSEEEISDIEIRRINTLQKKYGINNPYQISTVIDNKKKKHYDDVMKNYSYLIHNNDYEFINYDNKEFKFFHKKCNNNFNINRLLVYSRNTNNSCICTICNPIGNFSSGLEKNLEIFLIDNNISYENNNRTILAGLELDFYIPDLKIAIEFNGVYWHGEAHKDKNYHLNKTNMCNELGIHLIHIWEDDWNYKQEIIKSILLYNLNLITNKIYARKCEIREVSHKEEKEFLEKNHIQGYSISSTKLGLYYNNILVSLMTFGWRYINGNRNFELIRFCNLLNTNIIGGAKKLFNHFLKIKNKDIEEIISYCDISIFTGKIYNILNFIKVSRSVPNYYWVVDSVRKNRLNFTKSKLVKEGYDINKTEVQIMHELGHYRTWGCGNDKWIYKINS